MVPEVFCETRTIKERPNGDSTHVIKNETMKKYKIQRFFFPLSFEFLVDFAIKQCV